MGQWPDLVATSQSILIVCFFDSFENGCDGTAGCFADIATAAQNEGSKKRSERLIVYLWRMKSIIVILFSTVIIDDMTMLQIV
jgi:hypothetical protein